MTTNLQVKRDDWSECRFVDSETPADLAPGQVLFRVDRFALTSNNITYAAAATCSTTGASSPPKRAGAAFR